MDRNENNNQSSVDSSPNNYVVVNAPESHSKSFSEDNSKDRGTFPVKITSQRPSNENEMIQNLKVNLQKNSKDDIANKSNEDNFVVSIDDSSHGEQNDNVNVQESNNINIGSIKINHSSNYQTSTHPKTPNQIKTAKPLMISNENNDAIMFFFVNRFSGERKGQYLINMGVKKIEFSNDLKVTAYIYDINDNTNGIEQLKLELTRKSLLKVIICAGDGSVLPFIDRLHSHEVDISRIIFGVLPLGRSNDLSRQFGYGSSIDISSDMTQFKAIVRQLNENPSNLVDIWEMSLICDPLEGGIISRNSMNTDMGKTPQKDENNKRITKIKKGFIAYCSLGYDGRIGFGADKSRSTCKCWNSAIFFWEKIKKCLFRQSMKVNGFIESFNVINLPTEYGEETVDNDVTIKENEAKKTIIFQTKGDNGVIPKRTNPTNEGEESIDENDNTKSLRPFKMQKILLKGEPLGFVCQNIQYFFNGEKNSWSKNKGDFALETYDPKILPTDKETIQVRIFLLITYR